MGKATIRDVARQAGVSIATVSHVLNNTRFVSEQTRQKVLDSIQALGYSPDATARVLKTGRRNMIGFIVPDIANEFFATIIEEVESIIGKQNYKLIVANTKETPAREIDNLRTLASGVVDGMVVATTMEAYSEIEGLAPDGFPMVFVDRTLPGCPCDTLTISNYQAVYQGVEALIRKGHRSIGYITGMPRLSTTKERQAAFQAAMAAYGLQGTERFIKYGDSMIKSAVVHVDELLEQGCTALVVSNNVMTLDVYYYLDEKGIPVGESGGVDLLGYNDSYQDVRRLPRGVFMVNQPAAALGRAAGERILERIAQPKEPIRQLELQAVFEPPMPLGG